MIWTLVALVAAFAAGAVCNALGLKAQGRLIEAKPEAAATDEETASEPEAPVPSAPEVSDDVALAIMVRGYTAGALSAFHNAHVPDLVARLHTIRHIDGILNDPIFRENLIGQARDALLDHPLSNPAQTLPITFMDVMHKGDDCV